MARSNTQTANVVVTLDGKQAEKMLDVLKIKSSDLKEEIRRLNEQRVTTGLTGDEAKQLDALNKEYRETRRVAREAAQQVKDVDDIIKRLSTAPVKAIKDSIKALEAQMARLDRSTERYAKKKEQLRLLREELDRINGKTKELTDSTNQSSNAFDQIGKTMKRLASYVLVYAGFNQLVAGLRKMYDMNVQLSDQLSDIEKTTGLAGNELADLSNQIMELDTRTSVEQLNNLAVAAGKLGISAKEDVMGFVRAGNIINVALGEDLGQEAITGLSKLNDILGITKQMGVENALLATGSAINELGQKSTASEAYLVDFAQRMGGIAAQANLTIQQVLALGSVTDQLGQNVEVSATAMNKFFTTLVSETGNVAKAVGIPLQELQAALSRSTWEGAMMVFEKLSGKGGLAAIAPLMGDLGSDGARLNAVISALTDDTSRLTEELKLSNKAFAEGTSVINEYEKKNNNLAGTIEKIQKNIANWFRGTKFVDFFYKIAVSIEKLTDKADTTAERFDKSVDSVRMLTRDIEPLLAEYDKLKDSGAADEQQRLQEIMTQIGATIPSAISAMDKYGNVLEINTERAKAYIEAQKLIMRQNNKDLIEETQKTINSLEYEFALAKKQVQEIQEKGSYTANRYIPSARGPVDVQEYSVTDPAKIKAAQQAYIRLNAELEKQRAILAQLTGDYLNSDLEELNKRAKETAEQMNQTNIVGGEDPKEVLKRQTDAIDLWLQKQKNALMEARQARQDINSEDYISQEEYQRAVLALEMKAMEKKLAILGLEPKEQADIRGRILEIRQQMADDATKIAKEIESILLEADPIAKENKEYEERLRSLNLYGVDREKLTEDQLAALELLESRHAQNIEEIQRQARLKERRNAEERFKQEVESRFGVSYESWEAGKSSMVEKAQSNLEIDSSLGGDTETERFKKQMAIHMMKMDMLREEIQLREKVGADASEVYEKMTKLEGDMVKESVAHFNNLASTYKQYGSEIGDALGKVVAGQEDALTGLADTTVDILFSVLDQLANAWIAELAGVSVKNVAKAQMEAMATPDSVLTFGASGAARGALMAGLITGILAAAKSALKAAINSGGSNTSSTSGKTGEYVIKRGFSEGGFTGTGEKMDVAGIVHRNEYVVPKWQMSDPVSFDHVRALESIRSRRTPINPLPSSGFADGGPTDRATADRIAMANAANSPRMEVVLDAMYRVLVKLDRQGVKTNLNISNLNRAQDNYANSKARGTLNR